MKMSNIQFSLVIPMYNEENTVLSTAGALTEYLDSVFPSGDYEVIFVNDGSTDRGAELLSGFGHPCVRLCSYRDNRGKGCAVRTGIAKARGDVVVYTDCDLAYGTQVISEIAEQLKKSGADIVIGSRNIDGSGYKSYTLMRKIMSKAYIKIISLLTGFDHTDSQCGIKCFRAAAAHAVFSECKIDGFAFDLEALIVADVKNYRITEMPVSIINHRERGSKINPLRDAVVMLGDVIRIRRMHKAR